MSLQHKETGKVYKVESRTEFGPMFFLDVAYKLRDRGLTEAIGSETEKLFRKYKG